MIRATTESPADVIRWMQSEAAGLWPAILGSLGFRRSRCVHVKCGVCLAGEEHPGYVLYGRHNGRRFADYFPEDLVPAIQNVARMLLAGQTSLAVLVHARTAAKAQRAA